MSAFPALGPKELFFAEVRGPSQALDFNQPLLDALKYGNEVS
jgi:hypothetical protein